MGSQDPFRFAFHNVARQIGIDKSALRQESHVLRPGWGPRGLPKPSAFARSNSANCASSRILTPLADHTTCKALGFGSELCVSRSGPEGIVIEFDTFLCNCPGSAIWSCWAKSITRPHHRCAVYGFLSIRQRTHTLNALDTHRTHRVCRIRKNSRAVARCSLPCSKSIWLCESSMQARHASRQRC